MKPMSISSYRLRRCFATFAYDDTAILKFLVFDPCKAPGSSGAPRKAIGPVSCRSQLPMKTIRQWKSNMRLSARVAYLHFVLVRHVFQSTKACELFGVGDTPPHCLKRVGGTRRQPFYKYYMQMHSKEWSPPILINLLGNIHDHQT